MVFDWFAHAWMRSAERTFFHEIPDMVPNYLPWNAIFEVPWAFNLYKTLHSLWTKNLFSRYLGEKPLHNCFWLFVDLFLTLSIAFYYFPKSKGTIPIVFRIWHLKRNLGHLKKKLKKSIGTTVTYDTLFIPLWTQKKGKPQIPHFVYFWHYGIFQILGKIIWWDGMITDVNTIQRPK